MKTVAHIAALWRYPVKSMRGEACETLSLDTRGVVGDRLHAVRSEDGGLGSGKTTARFRRIDGLLEFAARLAGDLPEIEFPDGRRLRADEPELDDQLSHALGRSLSLVREAEVEHMDAGCVHLVTSASLRALGEAMGGAPIDARRFRPNLVLDVDGAARMEDEWIGHELRIGAHVRLRVEGPTERCRMIGLPQSELPPHERLLQRLARTTGGCFGVYASVLEHGELRLGDSARL